MNNRYKKHSSYWRLKTERDRLRAERDAARTAAAAWKRSAKMWRVGATGKIIYYMDPIEAYCELRGREARYYDD